MENEIKEIWMEVVEFPNYLVSNTGKIYSKFFKREMYQNNKKGYFTVKLSQNDKKYYRFVHRLMMEAFVPNPKKKETVNHIDENPSNNMLNNLEWATIAENNNHGTKNQRVGEKNSKRVYQYTLDNKFVKEHKSVISTKKYGFDHGNICKVCKGIFKQHKGFKWSYKKLH